MEINNIFVGMCVCEAGDFKHCGQQAEGMDCLPLIAAELLFRICFSRSWFQVIHSFSPILLGMRFFPHERWHSIQEEHP